MREADFFFALGIFGKHPTQENFNDLVYETARLFEVPSCQIFDTNFVNSGFFKTDPVCQLVKAVLDRNNQMVFFSLNVIMQQKGFVPQ